MSERIRVAVLGAAGRMGSTVVQAVRAAPDLELVAAIERGDDLGVLSGRGVGADRPATPSAQVAVDFTVPEATEAHVHALVDLGVHAVVGTTGWDDAALTRVRDHLAERPGVGVVIAPNFALGAVLAEVLAVQAARWFESVEIVEMHHPDKADAPSGTAQHTAAGIAAARAAAGLGRSPDATATALDGARGADVDGVRVHAVRLRGYVAHEEILLGNPGEVLTIRHDSMDRVSFMPGVLVAVRRVGDNPGLTVGLDRLLGLG